MSSLQTIATRNATGPFGRVDCYGMERDVAGKVVWAISSENEELNVGDGLVVAEFPGGLWHSAAYLGVPLDTTQVPEGVRKPVASIVTSPNASFIPDLAADAASVFIRKNGRFYTHDFTLFPQHYFANTPHLPYIRRRPEVFDDTNREHELAWYDMVDSDFVKEPGTVGDMGRVRRDLAEACIAMRKKLSVKMDKLVLDNRSPHTMRDMLVSRRGMINTSVCLDCAPQNKMKTLLTLTSFQRWYLESLAWYEYLTIWEEKKMLPSLRHPFDPWLMGAITVHLDVAQSLFHQGVPVWLVRASHQLTRSIKIREVVAPTLNFPGMERDIYPGTRKIFQSPPTSYRNLVSQSLGLGGVELGPSAREAHAGDAHYHDQPVSIVYTSQPAPLAAPAAPAPRRPPQTRQINLEKFLDFSSKVWVPLIPPWASALASVKATSDRIEEHEDSGLFRGYALPDAHAIAKIHETDLKRFCASIAVWLAIRPAWVSHITSRQEGSTPMPSPQQWKDFILKVGTACGVSFGASSSSSRPSGQASGSSAAARPPPKKKARDERRSAKMRETEVFDIDLKLDGKLPVLEWNGETLGDGAGAAFCPSLGVRMEVVWEIVENNWRLELVSLDRCIISRRGKSVVEADERDALVAEVFPGGQLVVRSAILSDEGLGARDWMDRMKFVEAFRVVLSSWPGDHGLKALSAGSNEGTKTFFDSSKEKVEAVEKVAYPFYCDTFFRWFGRAPTLPRPRPPSS